MDHTFKAANKAVVVTPDNKYMKVMKGGLLNILNEESEIIAWVGLSTYLPNAIVYWSDTIAVVSNTITGRNYWSSWRFKTTLWWTWHSLAYFSNSGQLLSRTVCNSQGVSRYQGSIRRVSFYHAVCDWNEGIHCSTHLQYLDILSWSWMAQRIPIVVPWLKIFVTQLSKREHRKEFPQLIGTKRSRR